MSTQGSDAPATQEDPQAAALEAEKQRRKALRRAAKDQRRSTWRDLNVCFADPVFQAPFAREPLTLVDVGARGGLAESWGQATSVLRLVAFDPDPTVRTHFDAAGCPVIFIAKALHEHDGVMPFHVSRHLFESSFLRPNLERMRKYGTADQGETERTIDVETTTLDSVARDHRLRWVDFVKLDTQGSELAILRGGPHVVGDLAFGLEVEVEFVDVYLDQPLFADVDAFVRARGFELFDLPEVMKNRVRRETLAGYDHLGIPKDTGQLTGGDALYFSSIARLRQRVASLDAQDARRFIAGALACCMVYGFVDYGLEILEECRACVDGDERAAFERALGMVYPLRKQLGLEQV